MTALIEIVGSKVKGLISISYGLVSLRHFFEPLSNIHLRVTI